MITTYDEFIENANIATDSEWMRYRGQTKTEYINRRNSIKDVEGDVPSGFVEDYKLYKNIITKEEKSIRTFDELTKLEKEDMVQKRVIELRLKLIDGTITSEEREELKLLIG